MVHVKKKKKIKGNENRPGNANMNEQHWSTLSDVTDKETEKNNNDRPSKSNGTFFVLSVVGFLR